MPPIRRKPPVAARPPARRPKIAGATQSNRAVDEPQESGAVETTEGAGAERSNVSVEKAVPRVDDAPAEPELVVDDEPTQTVAEVSAAGFPDEASVDEASVGEASADAVPTAPVAEAEADAPVKRRRRVRRPRLGWPLVATLLAIAVVFGAFAGVVAWKQPGKVDNVAYLQEATTTQVTASAKTIVQKIFSYDYKTIDQHAGEIKGDISPAMMDQYNKFFAPSGDAIKQDKSHVDATVDEGNIGVKMLEGDLAQVEMILNVNSSNDGVTGQGAQVPLLVNLERTDGKWIVTSLRQL